MISFRRKPDLLPDLLERLTDLIQVARASQYELQHHVCPNIEALATALADLAGVVNRIENAQQLMVGRLDRFEAYMLRCDPAYPRSHDDMTPAERETVSETGAST